ncbi:MAG: hypothetical protein ACYS8W_08360 [Planctomycetota bacterium]
MDISEPAGSKSDKTLRLILPIAIAVFAAILYIQDARANTVAQGDHGRDLYVAWNVVQGEIPYRDFPYRYGPLGPYAVAPFLLIFGVTLGAAFISWYVYSIVGIFRLSQLAFRITSWKVALIAMLPFAVTYRNHHHSFITAPALICLVEAVIAAVGLMRERGRRWLWVRLGLWTALLAGLKPNIGIGFALAIAAGLILVSAAGRSGENPYRPGRKNIFTGTGVFLGLLMLGFLIFIAGAPLDFVSKSFPYLKSQQVSYGSFVSMAVDSIRGFFTGEEAFTWPAFTRVWLDNTNWWALSLILGHVVVIRAARKRGWSVGNRIVLLLLIPSFVNAHEFFLNGSDYAVTFWAFPLAVPMICASLEGGVRFLPFRIPVAAGRILVGCLIAWLVFLGVWSNINHARMFRKQKGMALCGPGGEISVYDPAWAVVINSGVEFILRSTEPEEKIFCAPYDPVYCVLAHRRQAGPYLHTKLISGITEENEKEIVRLLKEGNVRCIVISNIGFHSRPHEKWNGVLGRTHVKELWCHISSNYTPLVTLGPWYKYPEWIKNHAIKIYWTNSEKDRHEELKNTAFQIYRAETKNAFGIEAED